MFFTYIYLSYIFYMFLYVLGFESMEACNARKVRMAMDNME